MSLTITLDDNLVAQLQTRADEQHISVEALVLQILGAAVIDGEDADWQAYNQRRIELIRQQFAGGLSADEAGELQQLQDMADQRLEHFDARMLDDVRRLYLQAKRIVDASSS